VFTTAGINEGPIWWTAAESMMASVLARPDMDELPARDLATA
jgi:hypothetical protein